MKDPSERLREIIRWVDHPRDVTQDDLGRNSNGWKRAERSTGGQQRHMGVSAQVKAARRGKAGAVVEESGRCGRRVGCRGTSDDPRVVGGWR